MRIRPVARALSICISAALLAACARSAAVNTVPPLNAESRTLPQHKTFYYVDGEQWFTVPAGVRKLTVIAVGARGGGYGDNGALGGRVWARIPVTPGQRLAVFVGGPGSRPKGGFNGGGSGSGEASCCKGYGGGGASDVRARGDLLRDRVVVAGGGGGEESLGYPSYGGLGGKGGGSIAGAGENGYTGGSWAGGYGGHGGRQDHGGAGGRGGGYSGSGSYYGGEAGGDGTLGRGGYGGKGGGGESYAGGNGGGGGGGYYGGGGGGGGGGYGGGPGGGGGGGSSYIESSAYAFHSWRGWKIKRAGGLIVFDW